MFCILKKAHKQYHIILVLTDQISNEPKLYKLLEEADEVWLSSAWLEWQQYIKDSL